MDKAMFDVRAFNAQAPSNCTQTIPLTYAKHETKKKTAYLHRVREIEGGFFSPLVISTTWGLVKEFTKVVKHIAELKAKRSRNSHGDCIRYIRLRLSFSMVRSVTLSIRGFSGKKAEATSDDLWNMRVCV